jgi:hypothetical protein
MRKVSPDSRPWIVGGIFSCRQDTFSGEDGVRRFWRTFPEAFLLLLAVAFLLTSCGGGENGSREEKPGEAARPTATRGPDDCPVARVGGEYIYFTDLVRTSAPREVGLDPSSSEDDRKKVFDTRLEVLNGLIGREMMRQEALEMGINVSPEEVDRWITERGALARNMYPHLRDLSPENLRRAVRVDLLVEKATRQRLGEIEPVTEEDLRRYYDENRSRLGKPLRVKAFVILIGTEQRSREDARRKIDSIRESLAVDLENAETWEDKTRILAEYARMYSEHRSASMGGYWWVYDTGKETEMTPFLEVARDLPLRTLSDVHEIPDGFIVTVVEAREGGGTPTYDEIRDKLRLIMLSEENSTAREELNAGLKEKYHPTAVRENILGCGAGEP